jgi:hypothetical protein
MPTDRRRSSTLTPRLDRVSIEDLCTAPDSQRARRDGYAA